MFPKEIKNNNIDEAEVGHRGLVIFFYLGVTASTTLSRILY